MKSKLQNDSNQTLALFIVVASLGRKHGLPKFEQILLSLLTSKNRTDWIHVHKLHLHPQGNYESKDLPTTPESHFFDKTSTGQEERGTRKSPW